MLFGENLAQAPVTATMPLPTTLGKTQVLINGKAIPLFSVSPTLIEVEIPDEIAPLPYGVSYATFQVVNDGVTSNPVTVYVRKSAPGIFAAGEDGIGPIAAVHADGSLIDDANPATSGEEVELFATGLGPVSPGVGDGGPGLAPPFTSNADEKPVVTIGGVPSPSVPFAGLVAGYAGLFQVNVVVPTGTASGDLNLSLSTAEGATAQTTISVQATQE